MKKATHGGPRPGSGRKPAKKKKVSVFIYVCEDSITAVGGKQIAKDIAEQAIEKKAKNSLK